MRPRQCKMSYKKNWSYSDVVSLISMYKDMPCLWEVNSPDYKDRIKRNLCLNVMANKFNTTASEITRKIHNLRSQFHSERQKMIKKRTVYGSYHRSSSKWPHFESLRFLKKSLTKRLRVSYRVMELHEPENESNYNENHENLGSGTAEPTSTVNVKQEPVDVSECEQDMLLVLMKDDNGMMEAHSSRMEQHMNKPDLQNNKIEAHCNKMEMNYSNHNCKPETCCNKTEAHFSRSESYYGKTEVQCGISDTQSNSRSELHSRLDIHNNRQEIHISLPEPHSSRSEAHCSRTEPLRLLKIEPNTERVNRRSDHSDTSPYMTHEPRRLAPGRNENQHPHCRHRSESISSTLLDQPSFSSMNEVSHNGQKREKQWIEEDQYEIFGKFVASELRSLNSDYLRRKMKRKIQRAILDVCEEEEHR